MYRILEVGINEYPSCPLNGCIYDATNIVDYIVDQNLPKGTVNRLLTDVRAVTAEIRTRLHWLVDSMVPGDISVFTYSGHGAQVATRNAEGEPDGLDEVICPVDFDWSEEHLIRDKEFYEIFSKIPDGARLYWFSDSCHSGDLTKEIRPQGPILENPYLTEGYKATLDISQLQQRMATKPRHFLAPPADIAWRIREAKALGLKSLGMKAAATLPNVAYISGCRDFQTSTDAYIDGQPCGAFTHYLLKNLRANPQQSIAQLAVATRMDLRLHLFEQEPQAEGGLIDRPFLS